MLKLISLLAAGTALAAPAMVMAASDAATVADTAASAAAVGAPLGSSPGPSAASADIVVTAQKRETLLQQTPISINALSGDTLENAAVFGINDLSRIAPGLTVTNAGPGERRLSLRGIRSAGEPQVAVYYDEAPFAGPPGAASDAGRSQGNLQLFDVERVEVLRGPQGTLYGASSMGGTVRVIYKKPTDQLEVGADITGSTTAHAGENYQLNAMVNLPIVSDRLDLRAVYFRHRDAGWIDNAFTGRDHINRNKGEGVRVALRARPVDAVTVDLSFFYSNEKGQNPMWAPALGHFQSPLTINMDNRDKDRLWNATVNADLGFADLVAVGTYQNRDMLFMRDPYYLNQLAVGPAYPAFCPRHLDAATCATPEGRAAFTSYVESLTPMGYVYTQSMKNYAGELRLQSKGSSILDWTVGGYWSRRSSWLWSDGVHGDARGNLLYDQPFVYSRRVHDTLKQLAGFAEASLTPVEGLTLTGGVRYYNYKREVAGDTEKGFDLINFAIQPWTVRKTSQSGALWKANVSWQATPDILVYAQAASGFRPGGANQVLGLPDFFTPYDSDHLWTYEAGVKSSTPDRKLTFNLTGFLTNWSDMQVQGTSGTFAFLTNAGDARVYGVEVETVAAPIEGLQFTGNMTLLSAKLRTDQVNEFVEAEGRKGDRIPEIPKISFALSGQYEWSLTDKLNGLVRADYNYVGRSYSEFRPTSPLNHAMGDYSLVGLRAGVSTDLWGVYLFVTNLFDVDAVTRASNMIGQPIERWTTAAPRTVGINLKFGI